MKKCRIAILGASSHIAQGLIARFGQQSNNHLCLFTNSPEKVRLSLSANIEAPGLKRIKIMTGYDRFMAGEHDVVINCVGVGTARKLKGDYSKYFLVTEKYDNLVIDYLLQHRQCLYLNLSSGMVYGRSLAAPAGENARISLSVNHLGREDYYSVVRINAEAKHRALSKLRIIDLRLFAYFSRYIDLQEGYFITELISCLKQKRVFLTDRMNIVRDYIHPDDFFALVQTCIKAGRVNAALDVNSAKPVSKQEILKYFSDEYGLRYKISGSIGHLSATGQKNIYCSKYDSAAKLGFRPRFSSLAAITQEAEYIISRKGTRSAS